jgi:hypothetical protein
MGILAYGTCREETNLSKGRQRFTRQKGFGTEKRRNSEFGRRLIRSTGREFETQPPVATSYVVENGVIPLITD